MNTVYKVCSVLVSPEGYQFRSAMVNPERFTLTYTVGEETVAVPGSVGVTCFPDLYDAHLFWYSFFGSYARGGYILECHTEHEPVRQNWLLFQEDVEYWDRIAYLGEEKRDEMGRRVPAPETFPTPSGTHVVPALTPARVMSYEEIKARVDAVEEARP